MLPFYLVLNWEPLNLGLSFLLTTPSRLLSRFILERYEMQSRKRLMELEPTFQQLCPSQASFALQLPEASVVSPSWVTANGGATLLSICLANSALAFAELISHGSCVGGLFFFFF